MLSQSHSVNTSIESCVTHLLRWKESQSQSDKNALCERSFNSVDLFRMFNSPQCTFTGYQRHSFFGQVKYLL